MSNVISLKAAASRYSQLRLTISVIPGWQGRPPSVDYRLAGKPFDVAWDERHTIRLGSMPVTHVPADLADHMQLLASVAELLRWAPEVTGEG